ncbi:MAG: hypothetical protein WC514_02555 [Candidatus Paceibacterota bacterium]
MTVKIVITNISGAEDIPPEIEKATIGLILEAEGPVTIPIVFLTNPNRPQGTKTVYITTTELFLKALKEKNEEAWKWFKTNIKNLMVCIETQHCALATDPSRYRCKGR